MPDERGTKVVKVNPKLHRRMKVLAAKEGTTIQTLTEEAIRSEERRVGNEGRSRWSP